MSAMRRLRSRASCWSKPARRWADDSHEDSEHEDSEHEDSEHEDSENERKRCGKFIKASSRGEILSRLACAKMRGYGSEIEIRHGKGWRLHSNDHDRARLAPRFRALCGRLGRLRPAALRSNLRRGGRHPDRVRAGDVDRGMAFGSGGGFCRR